MADNLLLMNAQQIASVLVQSLMRREGIKDPNLRAMLVADVLHHFHDDSHAQIAFNDWQATALHNRLNGADLILKEGEDRYDEDALSEGSHVESRPEGYNQHGHGGALDGGYLRSVVRITNVLPGGGRYHGILLGGRVRADWPVEGSGGSIPMTSGGCPTGWPLQSPEGMRDDLEESEAAAGRDWPLRTDPVTEAECDENNAPAGCKKPCDPHDPDDDPEAVANPCLLLRRRWDQPPQKCMVINFAENREDTHALDAEQTYMGVVIGVTKPRQVAGETEPGIPVVAVWASHVKMVRITGYTHQTESYSWEEVWPDPDDPGQAYRESWAAVGHAMPDNASVDDQTETRCANATKTNRWPLYEVNGDKGVAIGTVVQVWAAYSEDGSAVAADTDVFPEGYQRRKITGHYLFDCGLTNEAEGERLNYCPDPGRNWQWHRNGPPVFSPGIYQPGDIVQFADLDDDGGLWYRFTYPKPELDPGQSVSAGHPLGPVLGPSPAYWSSFQPHKGVSIPVRIHLCDTEDPDEYVDAEIRFDSHGHLSDISVMPVESSSSGDDGGSGGGGGGGGGGGDPAPGDTITFQYGTSCQLKGDCKCLVVLMKEVRLVDGKAQTLREWHQVKPECCWPICPGSGSDAPTVDRWRPCGATGSENDILLPSSVFLDIGAEFTQPVITVDGQQPCYYCVGPDVGAPIEYNSIEHYAWCNADACMGSDAPGNYDLWELCDGGDEVTLFRDAYSAALPILVLAGPIINGCYRRITLNVPGPQTEGVIIAGRRGSCGENCVADENREYEPCEEGSGSDEGSGSGAFTRLQKCGEVDVIVLPHDGGGIPAEAAMGEVYGMTVNSVIGCWEVISVNDPGPGTGESIGTPTLWGPGGTPCADCLAEPTSRVRVRNCQTNEEIVVSEDPMGSFYAVGVFYRFAWNGVECCWQIMAINVPDPMTSGIRGMPQPSPYGSCSECVTGLP